MVLHTIVFAVNKHRSGTSLHPNKICAERERERELNIVPENLQHEIFSDTKPPMPH